MENTLLNLVPASYLPEIHLSQYDVGRTITFTLKDGASDYSVPSGASITVKATKPSGLGFVVNAVADGNVVTLSNTETMTNENGRFPAELSITQGSTVIGTSNFIFNIERSPHPEGTIDGDAESLLPELTLLVERIEAAASSILDMEVEAETLPSGSQAAYSYDESLNKATFGIPQGEPGAGAIGTVASAYDASKTYAVGDYAIHNNDLYRCITAITTAETFTASHWTKIVLVDDVTDLKTDLDMVKSVAVIDVSTETQISLTMNNNQSLSLMGEIITGGQNGWMVSDMVEISDYDHLIITAGSGYNHLLYAFYDSNQTFISGLESGSGVLNITNENVRIPENAVYFRIARNALVPCSATGVITAYENALSETITELETETAKIKEATVTVINEEIIETLSMTDNTSLSPTGEIITGGQSGWETSNLVDISSYDSLIVTAGSGYNHLLYAFYDENETFISGLNSGSGVLNITDETVSIPSGAKYIRTAKNASASTSLKGVTITNKNSALAKWKGKKWTVVGDSLTEVNSRTSKRYWDYIAEETGISVHCEAVGGTGYYSDKDNNRAFFQRIMNVPTDSDVVTILGSANDGNYMANLGTATDTGTDTIGGCINTTIDNLYSIMPVVQLGIISPAPIIGANPYTQPYFNAYVALLEEICKRRSIPFLNLYYESNLRPWNAEFRQLVYTKDDGNGVHPDETGHKIIASRIKEFLNTLLM